MECYVDTKEVASDTVGIQGKIGGYFREDLIHKMLPEMSVKGWLELSRQEGNIAQRNKFERESQIK